MGTPEQPRQLPLRMPLGDEATLDNFLFFQDMPVLREALTRAADSGGEQFIYLHGPSGSGRSHLLQALCQSQTAGDALYLPLRDTSDMAAAELLEGAEFLRLLCLDDLDAICGRGEWERALFGLYNRMREQNCRLLCSAGQAPRHLPVILPDLRSRLAWGLTLKLPEPGDEQKLAILQFRASRLGLQLPAEVGRYIMSRATRSMAGLITVLGQLDQASLAQQRQLTVPFVKGTLGW